MCGIAGIYRPNHADPADPARLQRMAGLLAHRGPDDSGFLLLNSHTGLQAADADVLLANQRLAIIDLSPAGHQPMQNETGDVFLVFNGEIYNYRELRSQLVGRHQFRSHTDTEVILHAYEEWGEECVTRLNGMWAFALWDQRKRQLFCSRDRFGVKPFYYAFENGAFLFASELKAIVPALSRPPHANQGVISDYLLDGWLCRSKETFIEGIERLDPAHNLTVSANGSRLARYWDYPAGRHGSKEPASELRALLADSVKLRMRADVPVGMALSGGIDSTSILSLASGSEGQQPMQAFTAVFPGEPYDEEPFARLAAQHAGASLSTIEYHPRNFVHDLREVTWALDYPALEPQVLARREIMRSASRQIKVIFEGQGADEMLAGYINRYAAPHMLDELGRKNSRPSQVWRDWQAVSRLNRRASYESLLRELLPGSLPLRSIRRLWESNNVYTREFLQATSGRIPQAPGRKYEDRLTNLLHFDHAVGILPALLKFGDALSMMHSIESRLPFLDYRLVEFVFGLDPRQKLNGPFTKPVLRDAMNGAIPEAIRLRRDKVGFFTPLARWMKDTMESDIRPLLLSPRCAARGIFDPAKMRKVLEAQMAGTMRAEYPIYRWLSVELWYRLFIDGEGYNLGCNATQSETGTLAKVSGSTE